MGVYPHGAAPEGVEDLSGGVWEWCLNRYYDPSNTRVDVSGDWRALRGGSWVSTPDDARAGDRDGLPPVNRYDDIGFRVLSSVPMSAVP